MALRNRLKRLGRRAGGLLPERVVFVTDDAEEVPFAGDPLDLLVEDWKAAVEGRPAEHPLAAYRDRGLRLKNPERVSDPLWRTLHEAAEAELGRVQERGDGA